MQQRAQQVERALIFERECRQEDQTRFEGELQDLNSQLREYQEECMSLQRQMYELQVSSNPSMARAEEIPYGSMPPSGLKNSCIIDPNRPSAQKHFDRLTSGSLSESNAQIQALEEEIRRQRFLA